MVCIMGPIFDIIEGLPKFFKHSLDDAAEDIIKLSMLYCANKFHTKFIIHHTAITYLAHTVYYVIANNVSDYIADKVDIWKNSWFGLEGSSNNNQMKNKNFIIDELEDVVEDVSKFSLLYGSYKVGVLIADSHVFETFLASTNLPYAQNIGKMADLAIKCITPLTEYTRCNEYSDKIGNYAQNSTEFLTDFIYNAVAHDEI
jgi:hypothetical protein